MRGEQKARPTIACRAPTEKEAETLGEIARKAGYEDFAKCKKDLWRADEYLILLGRRVIGYAGLLVDTTGWWEELTPEIQVYMLDPQYQSYDRTVRRLLEKELANGNW